MTLHLTIQALVVFILSIVCANMSASQPQALSRVCPYVSLNSTSTATSNTIDPINTTVTMSTHINQPAISSVIIDNAPYTSRLLRYDAHIKRVMSLLTTMRAVLFYLTASERFQLNALIQASESLHTAASKELESLLNHAELLIQYEYVKPSRILKSNVVRDEVELGFIVLGAMIDKLVRNGVELEAMRVRLLQLWDEEALQV